MLRVPALLLLLVLTACSSFGGPETETGTNVSVDTEGTIVNQTSASLLWLALDAEAAALVDPSPTIEVTEENRSEVLAPGASAPLRVMEYREGEDFVCFLYRVESDLATFTAVQPVDADDFERDGTVLVERL